MGMGNEGVGEMEMSSKFLVEVSVWRISMEDDAITVIQEKQDITVIKLCPLSFLLFHCPGTTSKEKVMSSQKHHSGSCKLLYLSSI